MFNINELKEIIDKIDNSSITDFELCYEGANIKIKKNTGIIEHVEKVRQEEAVKSIPQVEQVISTEKKTEDVKQITSPMVGTFYKSSSPESDVYVKIGDKIEENTVVCIVEAMKLFNEIEAEVSGEIVDILVEDGQLVEYGQPLYIVK